MFYFIPAVWGTGGIHTGTGNVETSERHSQTLFSFPTWPTGEPYHCISMLLCCTWTGLWACWGTLAALGSCGSPNCSCWPLGKIIGVSWLPWLGNISWGPWGPKGLANWGFKFTICGVSRTSGCCCSTNCGRSDDAWRRRHSIQFSFSFFYTHIIHVDKLPVPVLVQVLRESIHSVSGSEHTNMVALNLVIIFLEFCFATTNMKV